MKTIQGRTIHPNGVMRDVCRKTNIITQDIRGNYKRRGSR